MDQKDMQFLFAYNYWARDQILNKVIILDMDHFMEPKTYGHGSIRNTLVHVLNAEWVWRTRCQQNISPSEYLVFEDYPTVKHIQHRWKQEEERMWEFIHALSCNDLNRLVRYKRKGSEQSENILWQILLHIVNHGTEHRSILAKELTMYSNSPGDLDIIHYVRSINVI